MCGICGFWLRNSGDLDPQKIIKSMCDCIAHRGPDNEGYKSFPEENVFLGHRRLSIIDLSTAANQPMANEDNSIWVVFNGEIYNYKSLRDYLIEKGHIFRSKTDTEVIIHLYEEKGEKLFNDLNGMFSIAIYDKKRKRFILGRDRIGIKPLFYASSDNWFVFGSELKAIINFPEIELKINKESVFHFLTLFSVPTPDTMIQNVKKLPPAHYLIFDIDRGIKINRYWYIKFKREYYSANEDKLISKIDELLHDAIKKRLQADVNVGVFLSGGIDSSLITAIMSHYSDRVKTFTVGFRDDKSIDERDYAREVSKIFNTEHHEIVIDYADFRKFLPRFISIQDEPIGDPVCVPLYFVSSQLRKHDVTVVLVGEGADEEFLGYRFIPDFYLKWLPLRKLLDTLPTSIKRLLFAIFAYIPDCHRKRQIMSMLYASIQRLPYYYNAGIAISDYEKREILSEDMKIRFKDINTGDVINKFLEELRKIRADPDFFEKMFYLEFRHRHPELLLMRVDRFTMATSNEARVPFMDHRIVEFAANIGPEMKLKDNETKYILKKYALKYLPEKIVYRKKQGFAIPISEWMSTKLSDLVETVIFNSELRKEELFDYRMIRDKWERYLRGDQGLGIMIWAIFNLSLWYDYWIAGIDIEKKYMG